MLARPDRVAKPCVIGDGDDEIHIIFARALANGSREDDFITDQGQRLNGLVAFIRYPD